MISVVVTAFNLEKYIERTLESIIKQTYKDIEIIVVDDGSTDNTGEIIEKYAEKHFDIVRVIHQSDECKITWCKGGEG